MRRARRPPCDGHLGLARNSALKQTREGPFSYVFTQVFMEGAGDDGAVKSEQQVEFRVHFLGLAGGIFRGRLLILQEAFQRLIMRNLA